MLTRWDPFREMFNLRSEMDRLFDNFFDTQLSDWAAPSPRIALDVVEDENGYQVQAAIPGIDPDDLEITYNNNFLTIQGEVKADREVEESRYHLRERRYGKFVRTITLPAEVNADEISASYKAGILTLHLPKSEEAKPKRIPVRTQDSRQVIEGKFKESEHRN